MLQITLQHTCVWLVGQSLSSGKQIGGSKLATSHLLTLVGQFSSQCLFSYQKNERECFED